MSRSAQRDLFVGITSWNSGDFIAHAVRAVYRTTSDVDVRVVVLDNESRDESVELARSEGAEVIVARMNQREALNTLAERSNSPLTLLMHADVILLSSSWLSACLAKLNEDVILVSPEDIGCGPFTRPFGKGKPESSFLLFDTRRMRETRIRLWRRRWMIPYPKLRIDFYGPHVTHSLPSRLAREGYGWYPMKVHPSDRTSCPLYVPSWNPIHWREDLPYYRYGLGNFYSIEGEVTHYHNWFDRVHKGVSPDSEETVMKGGRGVPIAFVQEYTRTFLDDLESGRVQIPDSETIARQESAQSGAAG